MEIVDVTFDHTNIEASIVITTTLDEVAPNESWGVKNFRIGLTLCPKGCDICSANTLASCSNWKLIS